MEMRILGGDLIMVFKYLINYIMPLLGSDLKLRLSKKLEIMIFL